MTFKQRLPYFLGGLTIGIILVTFIFNKKKTTFDYGPNSRVLKNIRIKSHIYSKDALLILNSNKIDSTKISQILEDGNVDIWNKIKSDTCIQYDIEGDDDLKNIKLTVKNCDSIAFIQKITIE